MRWRKQGLIFRPSGEFGWMNSHAQIPTVLVRNDYLRIYFATRARPDFSQTAWLDVDVDDPTRILRMGEHPVIAPGGPGAFDEHGNMPNDVLDWGDEVRLYYVGWSRGYTVPYCNQTGLTVSRDGGTTFAKPFPGPAVSRSPYDPYSSNGVFIRPFEGAWHMWYSSGIDWLKVEDKYEPVYALKHAVSTDGLQWQREPVLAVPQADPEEASTRPSVIRIGDRWHMWFCYRASRGFRDGSGSYRIGYAWSDNLVDWHRDDTLAGIGPSESGWDAKMVAYPYVVATRRGIMMFYNGDGFGASGMGYAVLEP